MCSATRRREAGEAVHGRGVGDLLLDGARGAGGAEHLEPGAGVAEGPGGDLDGLALELGGDLAERRHRQRHCRLRVGGGRELVLEVEHLVEQQEALVGRAAVEAGEELGHLGLPAGVDLGAGHAGLGVLERSGVSK